MNKYTIYRDIFLEYILWCALVTEQNNQNDSYEYWETMQTSGILPGVDDDDDEDEYDDDDFEYDDDENNALDLDQRHLSTSMDYR